jgi:hypothetical protein
MEQLTRSLRTRKPAFAKASAGLGHAHFYTFYFWLNPMRQARYRPPPDQIPRGVIRNQPKNVFSHSSRGRFLPLHFEDRCMRSDPAKRGIPHLNNAAPNAAEGGTLYFIRDTRDRNSALRAAITADACGSFLFSSGVLVLDIVVYWGG